MSYLKSVAVASLVLLLQIQYGGDTRAAGPATTQAVADDQERMRAWWEELAKPEPFCSKALLDFSSNPDAAVAFFKENLRPLKLSQADLDGLLKALGSDDAKVWKPAFDKMQYFDPRLGGTIDELLEATPDQPARNRLIVILAGRDDADELKDCNVSLENRDEKYVWFQVRTVKGTASTWGVKLSLSQLDVGNGYSPMRLWERADRAIVLLQHIGTPAAIAVLKEMATGNSDARPTQIAKLALESLNARN